MEDDVEQELPTLPRAHGLIPGLFCVVRVTRSVWLDIVYAAILFWIVHLVFSYVYLALTNQSIINAGLPCMLITNFL